MKLFLAFGLLTLALSLCNLSKFTNNKNSNSSNNSNNSGNSNSSNSDNDNGSDNANSADAVKDKFVGTWELDNPASAEVDSFTVTFKDDGTYTAHEVQKGKASNDTGTYEIRNERLYCSGDISEQTKEGFKILSDDKMGLKADKKSFTFTRH